MSERQPLLSRLLRPIVQLRDGEATTALVMFLYSFLAMTSYNIIKPISRSQFIGSLGADNLPYVQLGMGVLIGFIMQAYVKTVSFVPRRWTIPATQAGMAALLLVFWVLFATVKQEWVPVAFYVLSLIFGILLISQFWTLANDVYDPRQAKRIFGFVGAGSNLGGATGAALTLFMVQSVGARNMLMVSAAIMAICLSIVVFILRREQNAGRSDATKTGEEESTSGGEALQLLGSSRHLQVIALVIGFAAIGAAIVEQQVNMAVAEAKGASNVNAVAAFLAQVTVWLSLVGFVVQITLTSRIHRVLGVGFALLILPVSLGSTALIMLFNRALWAPALARILDSSLRYTVDKTSREVLFLPLPADLKYRAKPFIDVTVDRVAKGVGALLILVLIKDWGLGLNWQQLSYASLTMVGLWVVTSIRARREYLRTFRRSLERQDVAPEQLRFTNPDPATIKTVVGELGQSEPRRVVYAIDLLDAMDQRQHVTPLLLSHDSPDVRARALRVAEAAGGAEASAWLPGVQRALADREPAVRMAAVSALAAIRGEAAADVMRPLLESTDPAVAIVAAAALCDSAVAADADLGSATLHRFADDTREEGSAGRLQVARAIGDVQNPALRPRLVPLMYDRNVEVALAATQSAGKLGGDFLFVSPLVSLLRHRKLKAEARRVLVGYGEPVVAPLTYFMQDRDEDLWVRRHVPSALAVLPFPSSVEALVASLDDPDKFLRFKAIAALERLRSTNPALVIDAEVVARHVSIEAGRAFTALTLHYNLFVAGKLDTNLLLARTLTEKYTRALNRTFQLLSLMTTPGDVAAVRHTLESGDARARSGAIEYLDNLLSGQVRKRMMLLVEDMPLDERIRKGNVIYRTRTRDVEDTVAQLLHDEDETIAAAAISLIESCRLWSLADDLEYVLAHRDVRDLHVFEAASWALAASRMKAERRRDLWQEDLPAVELADRLRHIPLFDFTSVDELFRLARQGRQVRQEPGRRLYERGVAPHTIEFLLDGQVSCEGPGKDAVLAAPAALAFEEVLEGSPMRVSMKAVERAITLSMTPDEFLTLLAENVGLAGGLFRLLVTAHGLAGGHALIRGDLKGGAVPGGPAELRAVDRLLVLQSSQFLAHATAPQLWSLSQIARSVTLPVGDEPIKAGGAASILIVLSGALRVESKGVTGAVATAGDMIGLYETLAGSPLDATVTVVEPAAVLKLDRGQLFDLLADHSDLLQGLYSRLIRQV